jgi:two-component system chemotaxis response regulator CheB
VRERLRLVVVGSSLGGMAALDELLAALGAGFPLAVVVAQHRTTAADDAVVRSLGRRSPLPIAEPDDKQPLLAGRVWVAPADYHLMVDRGRDPKGTPVAALSTDSRVQFARPSIDVLFDSAAAAFGAAVVGVVLTGSSADGAAGLAAIKARGGVALVQDPATAESRVMPDAAIAACAPDRILAVPDLGSWLALNARAAAR